MCSTIYHSIARTCTAAAQPSYRGSEAFLPRVDAQHQAQLPRLHVGGCVECARREHVPQLVCLQLIPTNAHPSAGMCLRVSLQCESVSLSITRSKSWVCASHSITLACTSTAPPASAHRVPIRQRIARTASAAVGITPESDTRHAQSERAHISARQGIALESKGGESRGTAETGRRGGHAAARGDDINGGGPLPWRSEFERERNVV